MAGTPGSWRQFTPASVTSDPASGTFQTGFLIVNVADGGLKRHAGGLSWEAQVGASANANVGFHGATPTPQRANANQAATDLDSVITLANELRAALVEKGIIKGGSRTPETKSDRSLIKKKLTKNPVSDNDMPRMFKQRVINWHQNTLVNAKTLFSN